MKQSQNQPTPQAQSYSGLPSSASSSAAQSTKKSKKPTGYIIGMVICCLLAIAGVAFGAYGLVSSTSKSSEIADLQAQIADQDQKLSTIDTDLTTSTYDTTEVATDATTTATATINPVLSATSPEFYTFTYSSPTYSFPGVPSRYSADIVVRDGDIYRCDLVRDDQHFPDACHISGLSGKIYKIVSAGEGQNASDGEIAFILTDGTVQYLNVSDIANTSTPTIRGTYNIDGSVVDAVEVGVYQDGQPTGGYATTLFILSDGTYLPYSSINK